MTPQEAIAFLEQVTEQLAPGLQIQVRAENGQPVLIGANSRALHQFVATAIRTLKEVVAELEKSKENAGVEA